MFKQIQYKSRSFSTRISYFLGLLASFLWAGQAICQPSSLPIHAPASHILDRLEVMHPRATPLHSEIKGFWRNDAATLALTLDTCKALKSRRDKQDLQYLASENNEWLPDSIRLLQNAQRPLLHVLYKTPANLFEVNTRYFKLRVNPMANFNLGQENGEPGLPFLNQRGMEVRGEVDRKVFFYSNLVETQARFPNYVSRHVSEHLAIPGAGFYKNYRGTLFKIQNGYDFNVATAYLGFQVSRHIGIQFGHGQHFIGNGYRSILLSDFANPAFFLKISTRVWRLHYQNLFMELSPVSQVEIPDGTLLPKKFAAIHYLSFRASPKFTIGLFEAAILNRSGQFEFQYLNPLVFYRTVEGMIGSPDNVLLGLNTKYNLLNRIQLYGQVLLDEFTLSKLFGNSGWWANKYSVQAGVKYFNALNLEHLDLQVEYNSARPFTYSHADPYNSYTHYNQPLAHPLGANFRELLAVARYNPSARLSFTFRAIHAITGENLTNNNRITLENWGNNPLLSYDSRMFDLGNTIGQGIGAAINLLGLDASWMFRHNMFLDIKMCWRHKNSEAAARDQVTRYISTGIRLNMFAPAMDF